MDIEKAKINLHELQYELKLEQEENIKKHGYNPEQEIEAIDVVLNELDKKDKIINEMADNIFNIIDYGTFIDDIENLQDEKQVIDYFTKKVEGK